MKIIFSNKLPLGLILLVFFFLTSPGLTSAQAPCVFSDRNQGLISALSKTGTIGNTDTTCVVDPQAIYRDFKVPFYEDLENQYYNLSQSTAKRTDPLPNGSLNNLLSVDGIYLQPGDMTISELSNGSGVQVIFVRGTLNITGNITYADSDPYSGLVFIVQGDIYIDSPAVTQVNAVLISSGFICTAYNRPGGSCFTPAETLASPTPQLIIYGSLISLNKTNIPSPGSAILLRRDLANNTLPAEVINKQAKYLYILRNGLLTRDLVLTQEDANYSIAADPGGGPGPTPTPAPVCDNPTDPLSTPVTSPSIPWIAISTCVVSIIDG